jgi:hypothetical protein
MDAGKATAAILSYLDRDDRPFIWHVVSPEREIWINASTGAVIPRKQDGA